MARYPYSSYEVEPMAQYQYRDYAYAMQSPSRRFFSAVGRFFYRLVLLTLIVGALAGGLFALYRNDVLLAMARGAGLETQYRSLEQRIGAPGWGTPRSTDLPSDGSGVSSPSAGSLSAQEKQPETVQASATERRQASTPEGLPIVSFDSLPTAPAKAAASEALSPTTLTASEAARETRSAPSRTARAEPAPRQRAPKAESVELTRSIPLPKPKPEPVAKVEPKPAPPPPKPAPKEDRTAPRANDNPLKAAIRASMAAKKSGN